MGDEVIKEKCLELIDEHGKQTLESESFTELQSETVKTIISRDTLDVPSEVNVWNACVKWADAECKRQGKQVRYSFRMFLQLQFMALWVQLKIKRYGGLRTVHGMPR